ncbi:MAG: ribosome recycling factor [Victivallaceae bacterium]
MSFIDEIEKKMQQAVVCLQQELKGLRTGRANPALIENVTVDVYGTSMRLSEAASISVPETRQLLVTPYDQNNVSSIAKGIMMANLNLQPEVEGNIIRIKIPEPDATLRAEMVKQARKKNEEAKIVVRNVRHDANDKLKKKKLVEFQTEDAIKGAEKKIQDLTNKYCKAMDDLTKDKEAEIITI